MNNTQLYLAIGMPTLAVLVGILVNSMQFNAQMGALGARISTIENSLNARLSSLESRITAIENRFQSLETKFDLLMSKVIDIDNRLTRLER